MQPERQPQSADYAEAIATLVADMPLERAAQVYDFARFIQSQPAHPSSTVLADMDWLNDSEEQMQAEDALSSSKERLETYEHHPQRTGSIVTGTA